MHHPRYCILEYEKISAKRARDGRARVSVNFHEFSPCIARARRKQKYQNGSIHRKLKVLMSVIFSQPSTQYRFLKNTVCASKNLITKLARDKCSSVVDVVHCNAIISPISSTKFSTQAVDLPHCSVQLYTPVPSSQQHRTAAQVRL